MNSFVKYLSQYNQDIQPVIDNFFESEKKMVEKIAPIAKIMVDDLKEFLEGGKKLRGALTLLGYEMFGGAHKNTGLLASLVIEIVHAALLIHDDFMDRDDLRRGKPTIHKKYSKYGEHYGASMAVNIGDEGLFTAMNLLSSLDIDGEKKAYATKFLSRLLMETGLGQALDISYEKEKFREEDILRLHRYKTAEYTISGPISIGAILAGASEKDLVKIKEFGIPIGIAFQIRDDELGLFGKEKELGKPVDSDLRESKATLLIIKAFESAKGADLEFLKFAWGNKNLSMKEIEKVREIIKRAGVIKYSEKLSREYVRDGSKFIPKVTKSLRYQKLLSDLAEFTIERQS